MDEEMKESNDGLSRRKLLVKGAIVVGAAAAAMYVPPKLRPLALPSAHAKASPANKESCEKDANEDCEKCLNDKDPTEKSTDGPPKDASYDKCVQDKPCDKDPSADKDPNEKDPNADKDPGEKDPNTDKHVDGSAPQAEPKRFAGPTKDEWG
jgi:hypothetical protein